MSSTAEARFGKRSPPDEHQASSPSSKSDDKDSEESGSDGGSRGALACLDVFSQLLQLLAHSQAEVHVHAPGAAQPAPPEPARPAAELQGPDGAFLRPEPASVRLVASFDGHGFRDGLALSARFLAEGEQLGVALSYSHLAVGTDDGSPGIDRIQQATVHLTFAVLAGPSGRLRIEAGADAAFAPDLTVVGPTLGLSGNLWLGEYVALEGSAMVTPFPYEQLELRAGVGLSLGQVGLRGGWRTLVLDDKGLVDGVRHRDAFHGPYLGLAVAF